MEMVNTVLLDTVDRGAANPWGRPGAQTAKTSWSRSRHPRNQRDGFPGADWETGEAGTAQLAGSDCLTADRFARRLRMCRTTCRSWSAARTAASCPQSDLGPRSVVVVGQTAYVANYFSDTLTAIALDGTHPTMETIPLGPKPKMTAERQGEFYFNDARICFQGWQSCASCHPGERPG